MKVPSEAAREPVCVLFPGALGDFICVQPALLHLAKKGRVDFYGRSEFADLLPAEINAQSIERDEIARLFVNGGGADPQVRGFFSRYAFVYSWTGSGQAVFLRELNRLTSAAVFPFRPSNREQHQMDYYLSCVAPELIEHAPLPQIPVSDLASDWWRSFAETNSLREESLLVIGPGSGAREKNWPIESFASVAQWWQREIKGCVLTLVGPVEDERGGFNQLESETVVLRRPALAQAAMLLSRCRLYLGNDSGITHLAAAVGAPTVALFGPSDTQRWAPRGKRVIVVSRDVECAPCDVGTMKSCAHRECLAALSVREVIGKIATIARGPR